LYVIPDGDRRYAAKNNLSLEDAYEKAAEVAYSLVKWILVDYDIPEYTFFSLSYANVVSRKKFFLNPIYRIQTRAFERVVEDPFFREHEIKVNPVGELYLLPAEYRKAVKLAKEKTEKFSKKKFNILVAYSGALDLIHAANKVFSLRKKTLREKTLCEKECFKELLKHSLITTPIDLMLRTASEKRLSDSPMLPMRYTEFYFTEKLFPELTKKDVYYAIKDFEKRKRTYGK